MGSHQGDSNERPVRRVTLSDYHIGKYPVTQALWRAVMGNNPSHFSGNDNLPVEKVSWFDCVNFCNELSKSQGLEPCYRINGNNVQLVLGKLGYRLPTEAEWEYAARGGNKSQGYEYAGGNNCDEVAWYDGSTRSSSGSKSYPVGGRKANELGLHDMSGNVDEWCWDWLDIYPPNDETNPTGPNSGSYRVQRGGSWLSYADDCRATYRNCYGPDCTFSTLGFRLVFVL